MGRVCRGDPPGRPYGRTDNTDRMEVIRHNNESAQFNVRPHLRRAYPLLLHNLPALIQLHLAFNNVTEHAALVVGANRNEICAGLPVIVTSKPNRTATAMFAVVSHLAT